MQDNYSQVESSTPPAAQSLPNSPSVNVTLNGALAAQNPGNGLGIAGFVLALIAVFTSWIPVLGWIIWLLGLIFSAVGSFKKPRGLAVAGLIISLAGLILLITVAAAIMSSI